MAIADAEWRGRIGARVDEHGRHLRRHDRDIEDLDERVDVLHDAFVAHRARTSLIVGIVAFLGSGAGGTLLLLVTGSLH